MRRGLLVIVLLIIFLSPVNLMCSHAAELPTGTSGDGGKIVSVPFIENSEAMKLPRNTSSYWFSLPRNAQLGDENSLNLDMTVSGTLLDQYSTVTLWINNTEAASAHIMECVKNGSGRWTVTVPGKYFKTDGTLNEITIITAQRSILGDCADIDDPANWVTLENTSVLNLDMLQMGDLDLSNSFSFFFDRADQYNKLSAQFIMPSDTDNSIIGGIMTIASAIGEQYPAKNSMNFTVSDQSSSDASKNRIWIGYGNKKTNSTYQSPSLKKGSGYLQVSKKDDYYDMVLDGADQEGLSKDISFFYHADYLNMLSGTSKMITTDLSGKKKDGFTLRKDGHYTLNDFGYDTVSLAGAFHQKTTFTLKQPDDLESGEDSYAEIHFRHSKALLADTSLLTVSVNNIPIGSIQLSDSNADNGKIRVKIPASALNSSTIEITVDSYNYLGKIDCSKDWSDVAWTVIDQDSIIYFQPGKNSIRPTLQNFPQFDNSSSSVHQNAVLLLPENASKELLEMAAGLSCREAQNAGTSRLWSASEGTVPEADLKNSDLLIIGDTENIKIPDEVKKNLLIVPNGKNTLTISDKIPVTSETLQNKILFQVIRSPWNFNCKIYVITYPPKMEQTFLSWISKKSNLADLDKNVSLVNEAGKAVNFSESTGKALDKIPLTPEILIDRIVQKTQISLIGLIIIFCCILLIFIFMIKNAVNHKKTYARARNKIEKENKSLQQSDYQNGKNGNQKKQEKYTEYVEMPSETGWQENKNYFKGDHFIF